jgi:hypothetical protein
MKITKSFIFILLLLFVIIVTYNIYSKPEKFKEGMGETTPPSGKETQPPAAPAAVAEATQPPAAVAEATQPPAATQPAAAATQPAAVATQPPAAVAAATQPPAAATQPAAVATQPAAAKGQIPTQSQSGLFDANQYIDANCSFDSTCHNYYSSVLINAPNYNSNNKEIGNNNNSNNQGGQGDMGGGDLDGPGNPVSDQIKQNIVDKLKKDEEDKKEKEDKEKEDKEKEKEKEKDHPFISKLQNIPLWSLPPKSSDENANTNPYTPIDNYSYFGALSSKGGNFLPVNSDFSSFRK